MALASVSFHPAAAQEAESAYEWYAARDARVADAFREELQHAVDVVARDPLTWPRHGRARRYVFPRFPFSHVYRMRGEDVEVLAYPDDKYLPSYLVLGRAGTDAFHMLFATDVEGDNARVITAYRPDAAEWNDDLKTRRRSE